jgi:hypothetical protein
MDGVRGSLAFTALAELSLMEQRIERTAALLGIIPNTTAWEYMARMVEAGYIASSIAKRMQCSEQIVRALQAKGY